MKTAFVIGEGIRWLLILAVLAWPLGMLARIVWWMLISGWNAFN